MSTQASRVADTTAAEHCAAIYRDGIVGLPGCFSTEWTDRLHADFKSVFTEARTRPKGLIGRGPNRYYFAVHPERVSGFVDLVSHPSVMALCEEMLGPDYLIIELGVDVPLPGAKMQPWHRDFATPPETEQGLLTSVAFNLTTVDVTPQLAPFEIAPGTHFDDGSRFDHGMFPRAEDHPRYDALASRRFPRRGDVSARTGLTLHRGTEHHGDRARPVLILGVVTGDTDPADIEVHELVITGTTSRACRPSSGRIFAALWWTSYQPIEQKHDIEGLMMGG